MISFTKNNCPVTGDCQNFLRKQGSCSCILLERQWDTKSMTWMCLSRSLPFSIIVVLLSDKCDSLVYSTVITNWSIVVQGNIEHTFVNLHQHRSKHSSFMKFLFLRVYSNKKTTPLENCHTHLLQIQRFDSVARRLSKKLHWVDKARQLSANRRKCGLTNAWSHGIIVGNCHRKYFPLFYSEKANFTVITIA